MRCPCCGSEIKLSKGERLRVCPYCKSVLDPMEVIRFLPGCDNQGFPMRIYDTNEALVAIRGRKTYVKAKLPSALKITLTAVLTPVFLLLLMGVVLALYGIFYEGDTEMGLMILGAIGVVLVPLFIIYGSLMHRSPKKCARIAMKLQQYNSSQVIALHGNDLTLGWFLINLDCNKTVKIIIKQMGAYKSQITRCHYKHDDCGGMYILYGTNNQELVRIPKIYSPEQMRLILPFAQFTNFN